MDKSSSTAAAAGSSEARGSHATLSRESTATITPTAADTLFSRQSTQTSASSSVAASPVPSREVSPTRPSARTATSTPKPASAPIHSGSRSRKSSQQDISPTRIVKQPNASAPTPAAASKTLSAATTPTLLPSAATAAAAAAAEPGSRTPMPHKSSPVIDQVKESPRWPVSPRLRSPPPILNRPSLPPPRRPSELDAPAITAQRPVPSPQLSGAETQSDTDTDDALFLSGMRTPARGPAGNASTLETVQEASPLASPKGTEELAEKLEDSLISEGSSQHDAFNDISLSKSVAGKANLTLNESGSDSGSIRADRRSGAPSAPPPLLTTKLSSTSIKTSGPKGKAGEASLQSMTVETETVTSIPQVALAPVGTQGLSGSLRTKPSSETIRPKKEKKKPVRKQSSVASGTASSKADIFEAKVASAVEEANSSDSEETFVYDSNPPDGRDRPQRFHSRTPSAASMVSQIDRNGMRSIHTVMESAGPPVGPVRKNMKFVNSFSSNGNGNESAAAEDDGNGTGRSNGGSGRGTARHHHRFGRWGRNGGGNGHPSLFAEESPFAAPLSTRLLSNNASRQSSGPSSPRAHPGRHLAPNGKRGSNAGPGYDLDDTTGADDERTPLIQPPSIRSARQGRNRRHPPPSTMRTLDQRPYRSPPSFLNRFASCLVLTVMLLLVVSGAIGFMFATSQPLQEVKLVNITNVVASEQELMLDITVQVKNPNVVVVVVDSANLEVFAKSPHAGTDSEWWRRPQELGSFAVRREQSTTTGGAIFHPRSEFQDSPPADDNAPNMRLGTIREFDSPLSFEGSFFNNGVSQSTAEVRLIRPGNGTDGGSERWERILDDDFDLILKGVLEYTLPLSQNVRTVAISGRTTVKPNAANDPLHPNGTDFSISL